MQKRMSLVIKILHINKYLKCIYKLGSLTTKWHIKVKVQYTLDKSHKMLLNFVFLIKMPLNILFHVAVKGGFGFYSLNSSSNSQQKIKILKCSYFKNWRF